MGEDRWVAIEVTSDSQWLDLCSQMERPDVAASQQPRTLDGRKTHEGLVNREVEAWTSQRDRWARIRPARRGGIRLR